MKSNQKRNDQCKVAQKAIDLEQYGAIGKPVMGEKMYLKSVGEKYLVTEYEKYFPVVRIWKAILNSR